jgi:LPXTG-motif cell wall-anchored protein
MAAGTADAAVTVDQRGVARDAVPDIGAYEDPAPVVPPPPGTDTGTGTGTLPSTDTSSSSGGGGGCTVSPNADFDAGLLGLLAAAASGLFLRRRREGKTE